MKKVCSGHGTYVVKLRVSYLGQYTLWSRSRLHILSEIMVSPLTEPLDTSPMHTIPPPLPPLLPTSVPPVAGLAARQDARARADFTSQRKEGGFVHDSGVRGGPAEAGRAPPDVTRCRITRALNAHRHVLSSPWAWLCLVFFFFFFLLRGCLDGEGGGVDGRGSLFVQFGAAGLLSQHSLLVCSRRTTDDLVSVA